MRSLYFFALIFCCLNTLGLTLHVALNRLNDSRCNESIVVGIRYLNSMNDPSKYVECVSDGEAVWHDCDERVVAQNPWLNCTVSESVVVNSQAKVRSQVLDIITNVVQDVVDNVMDVVSNVTQLSENITDVINHSVDGMISQVENVTTMVPQVVITSTVTTSTTGQLDNTSDVITQRMIDLPMVMNVTSLVNDTRCNETVVNNVKYLNHLEDVTKYVECVLVGVARVHECLANGLWVNLSWINCVVNEIVPSRKSVGESVSGVTSRSLTKEMFLVSEDVHVTFNDSRCNQTVVNGLRYLNHMNDSSKYVECVSDGIGMEHVCKENVSIENCVVQVVEENKVVVPSQVETSTVVPNSKSIKCVNGVKDELSSVPKCICLVNFTGHCCETQTVSNVSTYYEQILAGTFDMDTFVQKKLLKVNSVENNEMENETLVDYKSFVENIVGNYWKQIDRQGEYMHNVDFECFWNESNVGLQIQKMKFYTQKVYQDLKKNFVVYRRTLKLITNSFRNHSDVILRKAKDFSQTQPFTNFAEWEVVIKNEVSQALNWTCQLYSDYVNFVRSGVVMTNLTRENFVNDLNGVKESSLKYYNMVNDYGYWYLINKLSSTVPTKNSKYVSVFKSRVNHIMNH